MRKDNLGEYAKKGNKWKKPRTQENRENVRKALLGMKYPDERKKAIREGILRGFKEGRVPWNKGKHHSEETKLKIGLKSKGRKWSKELKEKKALAIGKEKNPFWKDGRTFDKNYNAFHVRKRRLLKLNTSGSHTIKEWEDLKKLYKYMCLCCKKFEPEIILTEDHIVPLSLHGTDDINNIQPLCQSCNSRKNVMIIKF